MKRILTIIGVIVFTSFILSSCDNNPDISIKGEVSQEIYMNMMGGGSSLSNFPLAYHVTVSIKNEGTKKIVFDEIHGSFVPAEGEALTNVTYAYDKSKEYSKDAYKDGTNKLTELEPGKSLDFNFTTNGYTMNLLLSCEKDPLKFQFTVFKNKSPIAGPFITDLPVVTELPQYELIMRGEEKAILLTFNKKND